ncbi:single-stranded-DNA-specific exonuclease RecJ [Rhodohalobacter sulfatireducens]|uniref:Single-stranded-DNA-specific exonuclease RecJ n=1 Tax=Rhodohalobacter sulfatireducens TaxID=2911366 RepID=A0ABS9K8H9_9BACT|nr:single-stranded-DNA-specific exonuclease RecJ [Rhodohalobacter sulfatireducens]MCG2587103.1 single-stranded-DNA-specific exonuclease RecJ [Rhodohalobacter sulfatireducens]
MSYRWVYSEPQGGESVSDIQDELNIPPEIAHLLSIRGIDTFEKAKLFFRPENVKLHDPFLMKDMEAGACRLSKAIRNHETVVIYGDYDVDGTTAVSLLYTFLKSFGLDVYYYIPHRFKEGYGINPDGIRFSLEKNADLIVSVDCGITAIEEAKYAREKGIDLIICDHHTVGDELPDAVAVLDPKRLDCNYPFDGLSGAGVGYKLVQGTVEKLGLPKKLPNKFLDLVAISIASDIVPIIDENRILMRKGLKLINTQPRIGIKALLDRIKIPAGSVSTSSIVFSIGPRINAAGRMGDATTAVELMIAEDEISARRFAGQLESINNTRKDTDSKTMDQAMEMLENKFNLENLSAMVLHKDEWHLGVIGIVASRLVDAHYRPAIMLSTVEGKIKGSARSIKGFNIYDALKECEDLLEQFGGHEFAAGLTMEVENLEEFRRRMNRIAGTNLSDKDFTPELEIACDLDLKKVNMKFWKLLTQFEPFGPGNMRPIFVSKDVCIEGVPTIVGNGHLKMKVRQGDSAVFDCIGFNMHAFEPKLRNCDQDKIDIAYVLEENRWNGRRTIQMRLKDIHIGD